MGSKTGSRRVLIIAAHASQETFGSALAAAYAAAATAAGHEVRLLELDRLAFDPILHHAYKVVQELEADLKTAQEYIKWADHLVFAYPVWWGGIPALLKGFLDRIMLPGFAFKYRKGKAFPEKLLSGRSAHLLVTMDTPPWYFRLVYRAPAIHQMKKTTLEFCGVTPVKTLMCGPLLDSTPDKRRAWLDQARALATRI
ncbi:NAD(P)H-dependent oxidoreductase [Massilia sp. DJPM01]|uniref:NAD(P)H-dependent oxidoreductase n=1 Tax=Massilia sp. DJPM01 TaxID=3024404 RepID=UPI00259F852E|nr:NAD(P)H-dependent oxidoreductase [Massilia sp. DJPM01]MDM5177539.1 NAD(P)H-dependent oxidoreductase [Massilia sp. DJPM01]